MAPFTESQAVQGARPTKAGLSEDTVQKIVGVGIRSVSQFAYISSYTPGVADESPVHKVFKDNLGHEPNVAQCACFRRAFHEPHAAATSEMRQSLEKVDEVPTRRLTQPSSKRTRRAVKERTPPSSNTKVDKWVVCGIPRTALQRGAACETCLRVLRKEVGHQSLPLVGTTLTSWRAWLKAHDACVTSNSQRRAQTRALGEHCCCVWRPQCGCWSSTLALRRRFTWSVFGDSTV